MAAFWPSAGCRDLRGRGLGLLFALPLLLPALLTAAILWLSVRSPALLGLTVRTAAFLWLTERALLLLWLIVLSTVFLWLPERALLLLWLIVLSTVFLWLPERSLVFLWLTLRSSELLWLTVRAAVFLWLTARTPMFLWLAVHAAMFLWLIVMYAPVFLWLTVRYLRAARSSSVPYSPATPAVPSRFRGRLGVPLIPTRVPVVRLAAALRTCVRTGPIALAAVVASLLRVKEVARPFRPCVELLRGLKCSPLRLRLLLWERACLGPRLPAAGVGH
jgi:hypothetical protein